MLIVALLCLVGIAVAQQPHPCTSPPQWEGRIFGSNEKQHGTVRGKISYDATYHRVRIIEDIEISDDEYDFDMLSLFDSGIEFVYDLRAHNCTRRPITGQWRDFGIPQDARSYGEAYIGSSGFPDAGVLITIWGGNFTVPAINATFPYVSTWTYKGCLPVSRSIYSETYGNEILSIYDVTVGISDPNVFIPRRECLTAEEYAMRQALFGTPNKKN